MAVINAQKTGGYLHPESGLERQVYFSLKFAGETFDVPSCHNKYFKALDIDENKYLEIANDACHTVATRWAKSRFPNLSALGQLYLFGEFKVRPLDWKTDFVIIKDGEKVFIDVRGRYYHEESMRNRFKDECKKEILQTLQQKLIVR